jgi:hypothetical protein
MSRRPVTDPLVWTNGLFFLNALLYFHAGVTLVGVLFLCSSIASWLYHQSGEQEYRKLDYAFAGLALLSVFIWVFPLLEWAEVVFLIAWLIPSFTVKLEGSRDYAESTYRFYHVLWHIMVFLGNLSAWIFIC